MAAPARATRTSARPTGMCVRARPLQHLELAVPRRARARRWLVPRAVVRARPLVHPRGGLAQPQNTSSVPPAAVRARPLGPVSTVPPSAVARCGRSSHGQPFSRAHFSVSRWPLASDHAHGLVPRAAVLARPLQHLEMAAPRRWCARQLVPRAVVLARPLQGLGVAALRRVRARIHVPRAAVLARTTSATSRWPPRAASRARVRVPRALVRARPLQHLPPGNHVPSQSRACTCPRPTGSRFRATRPFAAPGGGRPPPRTRTSTRRTGSRSHAPTSAPRGDRHPPRAHVRQSHGQLFARAH